MIANDKRAMISGREVDLAWHVGGRVGSSRGAVRSAAPTSPNGSLTDPARPDRTTTRLEGRAAAQRGESTALRKACANCLWDLTLEWDALGEHHVCTLM